MGASQQGSYTYEWPRPAVTVDAILITKELPSQLLLIQRKQAPYAGSWALPGGFVDKDEPLLDAALRELQEETSVDPSTLKPMVQIGAFGDPGRDPRGWTIGVGYATFIPNTSSVQVEAGDDAAHADWYKIEELPKLAFDHKLMLKTTFERMSKEPEALEDGELRAALERAAEKLTAPWHD